MATINTANKNNNPETAPSPAVQSPRHGGSESVSSPQSRRATRSPWSHIVRGESEPITVGPLLTAVTEPAVAAAAAAAAVPPPSVSSPSQSNSSSPSPVEESVGEGSENGNGPNGPNCNAGKRPAWNKPSNGAVEVGPVMGAVSWPALSESARASTKLPSEPVKAVSDGSLSVSVSVPQGTGTTTTSSQKQVNPSSTPNHTGPTRQRSMKRNNASASSNGGLPQHQSSAGQGVEMAPNNPSPKEHTHRSAFGSQSHSSNDHPQQRNSFRSRNPHPRGDGSHHHNYGGRRDQDRGSQDWNPHRNFNSRDHHMHPQRVTPRVMRPHHTPAPPNPPQFIPQPHLRSFPGPIGFEMPPQLVYVTHQPQEPLGVPFVAPLRPMVFPAPDPQLHAKIINQIDYYFSNDNLIKDTFLRQNMDEQGWVRIKLIASFKKVMNLTDNIQLILDAMRMSTVVEVQGDKIRRRNDWMRWLMPPVQLGSQTLGKSSHDMLSAHMQSVALDEKTTNSSNIQNEKTTNSSNIQNSQPQLDGAGAGADCS